MAVMISSKFADSHCWRCEVVFVETGNDWCFGEGRSGFSRGFVNIGSLFEDADVVHSAVQSITKCQSVALPSKRRRRRRWWLRCLRHHTIRKAFVACPRERGHRRFLIKTRRKDPHRSMKGIGKLVAYWEKVTLGASYKPATCKLKKLSRGNVFRHHA